MKSMVKSLPWITRADRRRQGDDVSYGQPAEEFDELDIGPLIADCMPVDGVALREKAGYTQR